MIKQGNNPRYSTAYIEHGHAKMRCLHYIGSFKDFLSYLQITIGYVGRQYAVKNLIKEGE